MIARRFKTFLLSLTIGVVAGAPAPVAADDTEIYLGPQTQQATGGSPAALIKPNILFLLDTSGSMSSLVTGTGMSRLANMKIALKTLLDQLSNVNVGLMRFTDPGGPILYPVSDIDADATTVEGTTDPQAGSDIVARVAVGGADDAEENLANNVVTASAKTLTLGAVGGIPGGQQTVTVRTTQELDVQEERLSNGSILAGGSHINMDRDQINGIRFPNVPIPLGAQIVDARLFGTAPRENKGTPLKITFRGEADGDAQPFTTSPFTVSSRPRTTASVDWVNPPNFFENQTYKTPDLTPVIQEVVCQGAPVSAACPGPNPVGGDGKSWTSGNALALIEVAASSKDRERRFYTHKGAGGNDDRKPRLEVTFNSPAVPLGNSVVALRFTDIGVPQGAKILSASLELTPEQDSTDTSAVYKIRVHAYDDAPPIASATGGISSRPDAPLEVTWDASTGLTTWTASDGVNPAIPVQTPDLAALIQQIVDRPGWCGNNALSIEIETVNPGSDPRVFFSAEGSSAESPVLRIDWDENSIPAGGGCIDQIMQTQIVAGTDDAEQLVSTGAMSLSGSILNMQSNQINGLRFTDINLPQGATVLEATLTFTAHNVDTNPSTITFFGEATDDALPFNGSAFNISSRPKTSASVSWNASPFENIGDEHVTVNLAPIVQEIVNRPGWQPGNALVIMQTASGDDREAKTFNQSPGEAPRLRIKVKYGGAIIAPLKKTVRDRLKEIVDTLPHSGFTPLVGQYYEAARYFRGEPVLHGKRRSHRSAQAPITRLSHPASYTGGVVVRPPGCTEANLSDPACNDEHIDGNPVYKSPIETDASCQANYIVLLTDGQANHNAFDEGTDHLVSQVENLLGGGSACTTGTTGERCGRELATFLAHNDQRSDLAGDQLVKTYTVGFNLGGLTGAVQFLKDIAKNGEGQFYEANNAAELAAVFKSIVVDILSKPTSFAAPSLSVNAFNKLFNRNEVYFSLFEPSLDVRWAGNVKKFNVCDLQEFTGCTLGKILDANGDEAIGIDSRIKDTAQSEWSDTVDGIEVKQGGAANEVPAASSRTVFTYTGASAPNDEPLASNANRVDPANAALTKALLGDAAMPDQERIDLINWILGFDVDDEDSDGDTGENRFVFEDPLHASPVAVAYGGTDANPVDKLFVATNGGTLRLINAATGEEEWAFIPQALLPLQADLRSNSGSSGHAYGLDLTPSLWRFDKDDDGVIEPADGDFVRVIVGMRRGGTNYYAIDATPDAPLSDPAAIGGISSPKLMWRIEGGSADYPALGQTWSPPVVTQIRMKQGGQGLKKTVLIFGGGHDPALDKQFGTSGTGNAIYIADAATGLPITSIGGASASAKLTVPGMDYPIVSQITALDSDGDNAVDRLYVGDLGGQVWRVDLDPELTTTSTGGDVATVGKLASLSIPDGAVAGPFTSETRKFYHAPDVVQVVDSQFSDESRYDLVLIGSGNRPDPLNEVVHNNFYALRDRAVEGLKDGDNDGLVDTDDPQFKTITTTDLLDLTANPLQKNLDGSFADPAAAATAISQLRTRDGWYIVLKETSPVEKFIGEKVLSRPVTLAGKLFFSTFVPSNDGGLLAKCEIAEGSGRLYGLDVLTGAALFADFNASGGPNPTTADRYLKLGGGIPSEAVPIFQKEGVTIIVGTGGGAQAVNPGIALPRERTFWYQDQ